MLKPCRFDVIVIGKPKMRKQYRLPKEDEGIATQDANDVEREKEQAKRAHGDAPRTEREATPPPPNQIDDQCASSVLSAGRPLTLIFYSSMDDFVGLSASELARTALAPKTPQRLRDELTMYVS